MTQRKQGERSTDPNIHRAPPVTPSPDHLCPPAPSLQEKTAKLPAAWDCIRAFLLCTSVAATEAW